MDFAEGIVKETPRFVLLGNNTIWYPRVGRKYARSSKGKPYPVYVRRVVNVSESGKFSPLYIEENAMARKVTDRVTGPRSCVYSITLWSFASLHVQLKVKMSSLLNAALYRRR